MSSFKLATLSGALLAAAQAGEAASAISVDPASRMFIDAEGRSVLFHGVNVVYKVDPYIPSTGDFDP